jgi:uncharacterized repeat protein (TIGR02543 family)
MMEGSGLSQGKNRITAKIRGYLMVVAIIVSLMTLGTPVIAGGDQGGTPTQLVVTYETNGGSTIAPQLVSASGGKLVFQYTPVKECFSFAGWYYDSALTQAYSGSDLITRNLTLYAKWLTVRATPRRLRPKPWKAASSMIANGAPSPATAGCRSILAP